MDCVDLKISPVERPIQVVVVNLALALGVLRTLNSQRGAAIRTELLTRILLIRAESVPQLIELCGKGIFCFKPRGDDNGPFKAKTHRGLETDGVICVNFERQNS